MVVVGLIVDPVVGPLVDPVGGMVVGALVRATDDDSTSGDVVGSVGIGPSATTGSDVAVAKPGDSADDAPQAVAPTTTAARPAARAQHERRSVMVETLWPAHAEGASWHGVAQRSETRQS